VWCGKITETLSEETVEKKRQKTIRILKGSYQPKNNLMGIEKRALWSLKANETFAVLPADKAKGAMVLGTSDFNQKITTFLEDKEYMKLKRDPTGSVERKTVLLLNKSPSAKDVCQQLQPQGSRSPRLHGLRNNGQFRCGITLQQGANKGDHISARMTLQRRRPETHPSCSDHLVLQLQWSVLQTNSWCGHGVTAISSQPISIYKTSRRWHLIPPPQSLSAGLAT
jgi:hypothetical protein